MRRWNQQDGGGTCQQCNAAGPHARTREPVVQRGLGTVHQNGQQHACRHAGQAAQKAVDALADNLGALKRLLAQELLERGDVEADEAPPALSDDAVLQEAAFVLACVVAGDAHTLGNF